MKTSSTLLLIKGKGEDEDEEDEEESKKEEPLKKKGNIRKVDGDMINIRKEETLYLSYLHPPSNIG